MISVCSVTDELGSARHLAAPSSFACYRFTADLYHPFDWAPQQQPQLDVDRDQFVVMTGVACVARLHVRAVASGRVFRVACGSLRQTSVEIRPGMIVLKLNVLIIDADQTLQIEVSLLDERQKPFSSARSKPLTVFESEAMVMPSVEVHARGFAPQAKTDRGMLTEGPMVMPSARSSVEAMEMPSARSCPVVESHAMDARSKPFTEVHHIGWFGFRRMLNIPTGAREADTRVTMIAARRVFLLCKHFR
eukprot:TRINITY_DN788_c0_g1_i8.p1 TRINITY_DN788_c0_g1~~TRINITY_DN788_c0_g1_i8.p1  ORF type:complete len:248 (+),score=27.78 TRINITY_DN788_c0_g1_i8:1490-2233(+)